jgi:hypothetical protein
VFFDLAICTASIFADLRRLHQKEHMCCRSNSPGAVSIINTAKPHTDSVISRWLSGQNGFSSVPDETEVTSVPSKRACQIEYSAYPDRSYRQIFVAMTMIVIPIRPWSSYTCDHVPARNTNFTGCNAPSEGAIQRCNPDDCESLRRVGQIQDLRVPRQTNSKHATMHVVVELFRSAQHFLVRSGR